MRAIDVMASHIVTATPQMTVQDAAKLMINNRISGLPIVETDRQLIGIITEGDLLRQVETATERRPSRWGEWFSPHSRLAADYIKSRARRLADIMTGNSRRNCRFDGDTSDQAYACRRWRQAGRDRQPRRSSESIGQQPSRRTQRGPGLSNPKPPARRATPVEMGGTFERIGHLGFGWGGASLGCRRFGGRAQSAAHCHRKHSRCSRRRGSHDIGTGCARDPCFQ